ncbi:hypothetical protein SEPCBS57363_000169 [Sporothrix epigloea]|uniref:Uncharacterized protein n=1 Tax=Sporothrix epigloea TaxID=1892477 RepID=A0ABP0D3P0_9PEZI
MASDNGSAPPETSDRPLAYFEAKVQAFIDDVERYHQCDDDVWLSLRDIMSGWQDTDFKSSPVTSRLRHSMLKHGVFVRQPRVGGTIASTILEAINGDTMPEWTQEMADAAAKGGIVYTNEPKLQALLGRDRAAPSTWREPHSATQGPSAIFNTPIPTVPAVNIGAVKHEPVTTAYGRTTLERLDTVRATPYTNAPTSYRFSTQARDMEELPAPDRNSSGKQPTMLAEGIDEPDNKQQIIISQIIRGYPEKNMYSGADDSMSLQYRLNAFHMNCTNMGLDMRYVMRVFPSMLTGEASHHFTSVSKPGLSWQDAVDLLAAKYETESQQRLREDEWRLITLASVCNDEQGVYLPVSRNLIRLCSILSLKQRSLSVFFKGSTTYGTVSMTHAALIQTSSTESGY